MTFDLRAIFVFGLAAIPYAVLVRGRGRAWALLVGSVLAIYWLQPRLPIRFSDYILPTATLTLTVVTWWATRKPEDEAQRASVAEDRRTLLLIAALVVGLALMRYVAADYRLTPSRPPAPLAVLLVLGLLGAGLAGLGRLAAGRDWSPQTRRRLQSGLILLIVILFLVVKTPSLGELVSGWWRGLTSQDVTLASGVDLGWLGFSYVAFRLIHTLRDRQSGVLPPLSLREYVTYVVFFPAYTAGPIDRAERFAGDFRALPDLVGLDATRWATGLYRIIAGMFKKFVIADLLAQGMALNAANAEQAQSTVGLWLLLYGYGLRLYFDFAGYTDIAIGLGILFGVKLPENFDRPYLTTNLAAFWQSWHMTLSNWVRFYVFTPLSRWLLTRRRRPSPTVIVFIAQLATMVVIGLWHGVTWNFFAWGCWHGVGLYVHKRWSDQTRLWYRQLSQRPRRKQAWSLIGWFLTFQYVTLGWVWFALPDIRASLQTFARLFGMGSY